MTHSHFLYLITVLIWGSTWFAIKFQLGLVAPELSLFYRFALASLLLLLFCRYKQIPLAMSLRNHLFIAMQGAFLFCINYLIFYIATAMLTSGLVAVVFSSVIFMNMLNGALFLKRKTDRSVLVGALIGLTGICLVFWPEIVARNDSTAAKGMVLCVIATYLASLGNILSARNQQEGLAVIPTNALGMGYGAALLLAYVLLAGTEINFEYSVSYVGSLLYLSIFGSILAFGAYLTLIGRIGADRAAYAGVLFPIVALIISSFFEGYQWTVLSCAGMALVVIGNFALNRLPLRSV